MIANLVCSMNWYDGLVYILNNDLCTCSGEIIASLRVEADINDKIWHCAGYYTQARIYCPGGPILMINKSPLLGLNLAKKAVKENFEEKPALIEMEEYLKYLRMAENDMKKSPREREAMIIRPDDSFYISSSQNWEMAEFIFRTWADKYFRKLESIGISKIRIHLLNNDYINILESPIIEQSRIGAINKESYLVGNAHSLDDFNYNIFAYRNI